MTLTQNSRTRDFARVALASVMLTNGSVALAAPALLARRLGVDPKTVPAILYVFRMFGVRTILVGLDLLRAGPAREKALREAPLMHASDTASAVLAGLAGLQARSAAPIVAISALNTILALLARPNQGPNWPRSA